MITTDEIDQVEGLGFEITSGTKNLKDFINDRFPGLQLFQFLKEMNDLLSPLTDKPIQKEIGYFETEPENDHYTILF